MSGKLFALISPLLVLALASGCATVSEQDFQNLQAVVAQNQRQIRDASQRVAALEQRMEATRRPQAELGADLASLRQDLMRVNGRLEETEHRLNTAAGEDANAELKRQQTQTAERLVKVEKYLGLGQGGQPAAPAATPGKEPPKAAAEQPQAKETDKDIYNLAMRLYKQNSFTAARERWEDLLKRFPKSTMVDDSQFWIGQCFYGDKKYEEAILAYNTVIKRYPKSSKVPASLYKQGLAFLRLGDKRTAKIVLTKLVKEYPGHSLAKDAEKQLKGLK